MFEANKWPGLVANNDLELVEAAVQLYQNEGLWQEKSNLCHRQLKAKFNHQSLSKKLIERIVRVKQDIEQHRLQNFVGSMLKHHNHASTKYMSQWITEKNRAK